MLQMWALLLVVALALVGLHFLPKRIMGWELKSVDLLSQLRQANTDSLSANPEELLSTPIAPESRGVRDSVKHHNTTDPDGEHYAPVLSASQQAQQDSLYQESLRRSGISTDSTFTPIEDYTAGHTALSRFYQALAQRGSLGRPVRIAVLGDSFIEGDIFTAPLRRLMQESYGGSGVGWMPLSSLTAGFRTSIRHEFSGWNDQSVLASAKRQQTFSGHYYTGHDGAWVRYTLPKGSTLFDQLSIYYTASTEADLAIHVADSTELHTLSTTSGEMAQLSLSIPPSATTRLTLSRGASGLRLYGVALEGTHGVSVDNMSLRGNSGSSIAQVDEELTKRLCELRPYDLIVLQYGLNVASDKQVDYSHYAKTLRSAISQIRKVSPSADILIMSVSDRATRSSGSLETMKSIFYLHRTQQEVAGQMGVAFWSTLKAMRALGGIGQMAQRGQAAKDYTHLTHKGGVSVAHQFMKALQAEKAYREVQR